MKGHLTTSGKKTEFSISKGGLMDIILIYLFGCVMAAYNGWQMANCLNEKRYWLATMFGTLLVLIVYLNKDIPTKCGWW